MVMVMLETNVKILDHAEPMLKKQLQEREENQNLGVSIDLSKKVKSNVLIRM
jgi:hypothetical protein